MTKTKLTKTERKLMNKDFESYFEDMIGRHVDDGGSRRDFSKVEQREWFIENYDEDAFRTVHLDAICLDHTGFTSFHELTHAKGAYRPTICTSIRALAELADAYDAAQEARGDDRRAFRYTK